MTWISKRESVLQKHILGDPRINSQASRLEESILTLPGIKEEQAIAILELSGRKP